MKRGCLKSHKTCHSEFISESNYPDNQFINETLKQVQG